MDRPRRLSAGAGLISGAAGAAGLLYGLPLVVRQARRRALAERCSAVGALALTYDDGPGRGLTPRVLDLLAERGATATFFALGRRAPAGAALLDRALAEGHEIACHSHDHLDAWSVPPWRAAADVERGYSALERWLRADAPYRPPHGRPTTAVWVAAARRGAPLAWWTVDSGDTASALPRPADRVGRLGAAGGGVLLLHDFDRTEPDAGRRAEHVLETTSLALDLAERRGWATARMGDLLAGRPLARSSGARARPA